MLKMSYLSEWTYNLDTRVYVARNIIPITNGQRSTELSPTYKFRDDITVNLSVILNEAAFA